MDSQDINVVMSFEIPEAMIIYAKEITYTQKIKALDCLYDENRFHLGKYRFWAKGKGGEIKHTESGSVFTKDISKNR